MCEKGTFCPPSLEWQKALCSKFAFRHSETKDLYQRGKNLGSPTRFHNIRGDGNCLFRALAYSISGNEENHGLIRSLIVSHLEEISPWVLHHETPETYLQRTKMFEDRTWGTEVELYAASSLFHCNIFVFSKHGEKFKWLQFKSLASRKVQRLPLSKESIYLHHRSECHYDIVTDVGDKTENSSTPTKATIVLDDSFDTETPEKSIQDKLGMSLDGQLGSDSFQNLQDPLGKSFLLETSFENIPVLSESSEHVDSLGTSLCEDEIIYDTSVPANDAALNKSTSPTINNPYSFQCDEDNDLSYFAFERKLRDAVSSTPKKISKKTIDNLHHASNITLDTSISNSSFQESMKKASPRKRTPATNDSKLLKKALDSVHVCFDKRENCKFQCLSNFNKEDIAKQREGYWTKTFENRIEWFYDKLTEAKKKQNNLFFQSRNGEEICASCFREVYYISRNFFFKYKRKYQEGCISMGSRRKRGAAKGKETAILWLEEYIYFHTEQMPDSPIRLLPYKYRKSMVYDSYAEDMFNKDELPISFSTFRSIWRNEFPHLKIKQTNTFSMCSTCYTIEKEMEGTRNRKKREYLKKMIAVHNARQMKERRYYYSKRENAKKHPKKHMSLIIDAMDQSKTNIPHFTGRIQKGIDPSTLLKTHIQGVINHGKGTQDFFIDLNEYAHDSNLVMNILLKSIYSAMDRNGKLPEVLYIQADNCARENKNKFVLAFCELLVKLKVFYEVHLSFLYVGHTHEDIDAAFSVIADKLRKKDAETLPQLQMIVNGGKIVQGLYDIKTWLSPCINQIYHHSKPLHFRFQNVEETNATVSYRENSQRPWKTLHQNLLASIPNGKPKVLIPPNFHNINLSGLKNNVEKYRYQFSNESVYKWWGQFISKMEEVTKSPKRIKLYAERQTVWLLPFLIGKSTRQNEKEECINPALLEAIDKEMDEHTVVIKEIKTKRHGGPTKKDKTTPKKKSKSK